MRKLIKLVVSAALLIAGAAGAAHADGGGIKGGSPPSGGPSGGSSGGGGGRFNGPDNAVGESGAAEGGGMGGLVDLRKPGYHGPKPWEIGATLWMGGITCSDDCMGQAKDKAVFHGYLHGFADITSNNRISARIGFTQRFLADANETGARMDDIIVSYTRLISLPWKLKFRIVASLALPTSYASQKIVGLYIAPTGTLRLSRKFEGSAGGLDFDFRVFAGGNFVKYGSDAGGNPNAQADFGGIASIEYEFWFLRALSIGVDAYDDYIWYYPATGMTNFQVTADSTFARQPTQQEWGGEVFVRYAAPAFHGVHLDLTFAYFHGDPTLGYVSVNNDGIGRSAPSLTNGGGGTPLYSEWGQSSGFYGSLDVSY